MLAPERLDEHAEHVADPDHPEYVVVLDNGKVADTPLAHQTRRREDVVVGGAAFVTLGAGVLLALVSFPRSVTHFRWPGVRPGLRLAYWTGVAMNAFLFAVAVSALL